jgi:predicted methyltransferase
MSKFTEYLEQTENKDTIQEAIRIIKKLKKETLDGKATYSIEEYNILAALVVGIDGLGGISKDKLRK